MNNRWRQVSKFLSGDDRWEHIGLNMSKPNLCPCCSNELITSSWNDERGLVETAEVCHICGYENNWSYGTTMLSVGGTWYEEYSYSAPEEESNRVQKEFARQIKLYRDRIRKLKLTLY